MAQKVTMIAQLCLDAFLQDFPTASSFFKKKHFVYYCILADAKLKQDEYALQVQINLRARKPNAPVVLNSDNYYTAKDLPVNKENKIVLPFPIMAFPGAGNTQSVSQVVPEGNCMNLMPITQGQRWMLCDDKSNVYWLPAVDSENGCSEIEFINKEKCNFKKATVTYIPSLTSASTIQEARGWSIINMVSGLLKALKEGNVIDTTNDANKNAYPHTEIDKYVTNALSQR